jgi:hypothetical protein
VRAPKKSRVGPYEDNLWIVSYGARIITKAYTSESTVWLLTDLKRNQHPSDVHGIVVNGPHIEYGYVNVDELQELCKDSEDGPALAHRAYEHALPCTLRTLFETTDVHTLFGCAEVLQ